MSHLSQKELDLFTNKILEDYDAKNPGAIFKEKIEIGNEDALLIQSNVARLREKRGEVIIGYKIGCVSKDTQKKMGFTQPACGYLWKSELYTSGVALNKKNYTNPAMEAEFGIILNRDIKAELSSFGYILESIEGIYPLIEIHNLIFYGNEPYGAELLANNAIHAGVVLGPETKLPIDKIETNLKLIYDNEIIDTWVNKRWPHDMLSEIEWLVKELAKKRIYLKKGDLILTGAYGFPVPINDKKLIEVTSSAFGDVKTTFY
ncbi:fumarylacetoacetate hydrolase family protein [Candidatus Pelagibacter sp.]|nr:fumarylacetoacetate hydrolase family protein [Candidatus Pelagibacter sp.]MDC0954755.1 fumarylacetoacetate hydrolase family protein [Candidatus Pelagibacter sp.]MDC0992395.1 fumarylacetoacetate hydrolase family protein [Candidatus Pelagibacter sp.]